MGSFALGRSFVLAGIFVQFVVCFWLSRRPFAQNLDLRLPTVHDDPSAPALRIVSHEELKRWTGYISGTSPYFCFSRCCWRYEKAVWPYRGLFPGNVTKEDLISPINNRFLGDLVYGVKLPRPPNYTLPVFDEDYLECLQPSTVLWVDTADLREFFEGVFPRVTVPIVLASGDSDFSAPKDYLHELQHTKILHWLAMNCDLPGGTVGKLSCLPLGVSQWWTKDEHAYKFLEFMERSLANGMGLQEGLQASSHHPKRKLLLACFSRESFPSVRDPLWMWVCEGPLRNVTTCVSHVSLEETYKLTAEHAFVLAPRGMGLDSYRTWETLYLGSYPIVHRSTLTSTYAGLPVVVLDDLSALTEGMLWETYEAFRSQQWDYRPLYLGYYYELLGQHRLGINKQYRVRYYPKTNQDMSGKRVA